MEKIPLPTEECRNILIGKTIRTFHVYYGEVKDKGYKDKMISFAKRQLDNPRNATRFKAERFLKKLEEP